MKTLLILLIMFLCAEYLLRAQGNGNYYYYNLSIDNETRLYALYVPEGYNSSEAWPLVFNFHWGNGSINNQIFISEMYLVADTAEFLIVYPQGLPVYCRPFEETFPGWSVPDLNVGTQDDVLFVSNIIDDIIANPSFNIDKIKNIIGKKIDTNESEIKFTDIGKLPKILFITTVTNY